MATIRVTDEELQQTFLLWLRIIGQRQPHLLRDIWSRRGDEYDAAKIEKAKREFARVLTQRFLTAGWDVMRPERPQDEWFRDLDEKQLKLPRLD